MHKIVDIWAISSQKRMISKRPGLGGFLFFKFRFFCVFLTSYKDTQLLERGTIFESQILILTGDPTYRQCLLSNSNCHKHIFILLWIQASVAEWLSRSTRKASMPSVVGSTSAVVHNFC